MEDKRIENEDGNQKKAQNVYERIYEVVTKIPRGKVATYGQIAALAGNRRWARVVGYALHCNPNPDQIPCYRVVNCRGEVSKAFAFGGENRQIQLLETDGIIVQNGRVDLQNDQWDTPQISVAGAQICSSMPAGGQRI